MRFYGQHDGPGDILVKIGAASPRCRTFNTTWSASGSSGGETSSSLRSRALWKRALSSLQPLLILGVSLEAGDGMWKISLRRCEPPSTPQTDEVTNEAELRGEEDDDIGPSAFRAASTAVGAATSHARPLPSAASYERAIVSANPPAWTERASTPGPAPPRSRECWGLRNARAPSSRARPPSNRIVGRDGLRLAGEIRGVVDDHATLAARQHQSRGANIAHEA